MTRAHGAAAACSRTHPRPGARAAVRMRVMLNARPGARLEAGALHVVFVKGPQNPWGNEEGGSQTGSGDDASKQNEPFLPAAAGLKSSSFSWCLSFPFHRVARPPLGHYPHVRGCHASSCS